MYNIKDFFKRIQNTRAGGVLIRSTIKEAIKKIIGIEVQENDIEVVSSKVTLRGLSQVARSEIFIKREALLKEINATQNMRKITEVR